SVRTSRSIYCCTYFSCAQCSTLCSKHNSFLLFFLMIRHPPRSTLFPTRRSSDLIALPCKLSGFKRVRNSSDEARFGVVIVQFVRSEEHTSELQSQSNLVCRLLLEKKKVQNNNMGE